MVNIPMTLGGICKGKRSNCVNVNLEPKLIHDHFSFLLGDLFPRSGPFWSLGDRAKGEEKKFPSAVLRHRGEHDEANAGMGRHTGETCKVISRAVPSHAQCLYECCLRDGYFPAFWKTTRDVVFLKSSENRDVSQRHLQFRRLGVQLGSSIYDLSQCLGGSDRV